MATTDARSGFRLPWSSDRSSEAETPTTDEARVETTSEESLAVDTATQTVDGTTPSLDGEAQTPVADSQSAAEPESAAADQAVAIEPAPLASDSASTAAADAPAVNAAPAAPARKPNKFLADLTRAMQAAAEEARGRSVAQLQADAKTHIETIHGRSATEAANLRRQADDDVAAVREWSKTEIARIREETEQRITDRKGRLESEIEQHAAVIEREIEAVQGTIAAFENQMAAFFERLLAEDDPTRFATMAENLPEPPTLEEITAAVHAGNARAASFSSESTDEPVTAETVTTDGAAAASDNEWAASTAAMTDPSATVAAEAEEVVAPVADPWASDAATDGTTEATNEPSPAAADTTVDATSDQPGDDANGEVDREAAFAAIQAAAEAAASAEVAADAAARAEAVADEMMGTGEGEDSPASQESQASSETAESSADSQESDPRFAALGLSPDYEAAEAEAMNGVETAAGEEIPTIGDDALAARLAGLVPPTEGEEATEAPSTQVVVVGLISVASIASFKRHLGRIPGVQSVGVSSGPDGEFVFAVRHTPETSLRDAIPSLPSFQARVTSTSDGAVHVTAHDPESDG